MNLEKLNLETLAALQEGGVGEQYLRVLDAIRVDIIRRPGVRQKRKLLVEVSFTSKTVVDKDPETGIATATLIGTEVEVDIREKLPPRKSIKIDMGITEEGFFFNPDSPHDHRQRTLPGVYRDAVQPKNT